MAVNGEGVYASRPYNLFGDGPGAEIKPRNAQFNKGHRQDLTADDVRYTTRGNAICAFAMTWPGKEAVIPLLGISAKQGVGEIQHVELLGEGKMTFVQNETALTVQLPEKRPSERAIVFKIIGA